MSLKEQLTQITILHLDTLEQQCRGVPVTQLDTTAGIIRYNQPDQGLFRNRVDLMVSQITETMEKHS
jgi:hypothetical protein